MAKPTNDTGSDRRREKAHHRLWRKPNKTWEEWQLMWDLAPPLRDAEGRPWREPILHTPPLSQSITKKLDEHAHQHRPGALAPMPRLQGPPPSPYLHLLDQWRPQKRKESYPAQGLKRRREHQD